MRLQGTYPGTRLVHRVRLYQTLRTAHLEQALELAPATIIYRARRYDFDEALAARLDLVRAGPLRAAWLLATSPVREFEINEPLMRYAIRGTAVAVAAVRARGALTRQRTSIVTYAIENFDPFGGKPAEGVRATVRKRVDQALTRFVWRSVDRIVYGTPASRELYRTALPAPGARQRSHLLLTLSQRCATCPARDPEPKRVVFLGALSERKGFPLVMQAWAHVRSARPGARLTVVGQGPLEQQAREWAAYDDSVEMFIDPDRATIHRVLNRAAVLTLPSQPQPGWREQLGLPITEALSHGVSIVTTNETGLAGWLAEHGHSVLPATAGPGELADAVVHQIDAARSRTQVLASLPDRDGRLAADDWLFPG